ncbi:L-threonylcarbamoyladenylate synthase [Spirosoma endophyticum]|uniref:L-threonylcarbamoyladenylate synthase n=1 Tax=Spirosoma endophyticum TaxID=662367 RepID=A0A1I1UF39_9BACT|nr:Sua5/YciO/YrdC/YwlC family protein [Spirosoma endophyticum]SFD68218.1 L-threonylcarbamoyladenylate synthase [Spirosoma endophyticum]
MIPSIRDIAFQLRQGQLVAIADETGWSIAADPVNDVAVEQLLTLLSIMPAGLQLTVLIQNTDQLGMYVAKVPDVAYDLVEFAENPLIVVYDQGKNISPLVGRILQTQSTTDPKSLPANGVQPFGPLAVRRSLSAEVQRLIGSFGRGLLTIPFESLLLPPSVEALVPLQYGTLPGMPKRPRIMRLGVNGEVSFIRK